MLADKGDAWRALAPLLLLLLLLRCSCCGRLLPAAKG
jgi:hypothetical protein